MPPSCALCLTIMSCPLEDNGPLFSQPCVLPVIPWPPTRVLNIPSSLLIPNPFISCLFEDGLITVACNDSSCTPPRPLPLCHFLRTPVTSQSVLQCSPNPKDHYKQMSNFQTNFSFVLIEMASFLCGNFCMCHRHLHHSSQYPKAFKTHCFVPKLFCHLTKGGRTLSVFSAEVWW